MRYCTYLFGLAFLLLFSAPPSANGWGRRRRKYKYLEHKKLPKGFSLELRTTAKEGSINTNKKYYNRCKAKADTDYGLIKKAVFSSFNGGHCKNRWIKWTNKKAGLMKKAERKCTFKWTRRHPLLWFYCKIVILIKREKKRGKKVRVHPPREETYRLTIKRRPGLIEPKKSCRWFTLLFKKKRKIASKTLFPGRDWLKSGARFTLPKSKLRDYSLRCRRACLPSDRGLVHPMKWIYQKRSKLKYGVSRYDPLYKVWPLPNGVRLKKESVLKSTLEFVNQSPTGIYYCESIDLLKTPPFHIRIEDDSGCKWNKKKCRAYSRCINKRHGFACKCNPGLQGNGKKKCKDIDECKVGLAKCPKHSRCKNNFGSYSCNCVRGYVYNRKRKRCQRRGLKKKVGRRRKTERKKIAMKQKAKKKKIATKRKAKKKTIAKSKKRQKAGQKKGGQKIANPRKKGAKLREHKEKKEKKQRKNHNKKRKHSKKTPKQTPKQTKTTNHTKTSTKRKQATGNQKTTNLNQQHQKKTKDKSKSTKSVTKSKKSTPKGGIIAGAVIGAVAAGLLIAAAIWYWRRSRPKERRRGRRRSNKTNEIKDDAVIASPKKNLKNSTGRKKTSKSKISKSKISKSKQPPYS